MRKILVFIFVSLSVVYAHAERDVFEQVSKDLLRMGGKPSVTEQSGPYTLIQLTDSTTLEIYEGDKYTVVMTVCAPQCSSYARVYNKEGVLLYPIEPTVTSIFPLATMDKQTGEITWKDNDNWEY